MSLRFVCLAVALSVSAPALLLAQPPAGAPPAGSPQGGARPAFKPQNLKVLPADTDIRTVMRGFTQALGVECEFCHAVNPDTHRPEFASDANPTKDTARTMLRMTQDLNTKYLAQLPMPADHAGEPAPTVTCGTCHRGEKMPPAFVPPPRQGPGGAAPSMAPGMAPGGAAASPAPHPGA